MKRREFTALVGGGAVGWPLRVSAQPARNLPVIGYLTPAFPNYTGTGSTLKGLKDGLRQAGYVDGENVRIEERWGRGKPETLVGFAQELVRLKVDVLLATARSAIEAAKAATADLPIVALDLESDPVASGYIANLAKPGGNITGLFLDAPSLTGKWLQRLREVVPDARRIAVLWDANTGEYQLRALSAAAKTMSVDLEVVEFRDAEGMEAALIANLKERPPALILLGSPLINTLANRIADISAKHRIPAISMFRSFPDSGGLMSYGPVLDYWFRRLGYYVSVVLKGAKPAVVPVERPTQFELILNMKAASAMGLTVPMALQAQANEVIE